MAFGYCKDCKYWDIDHIYEYGSEAYWKPEQVEACKKVLLLADCVVEDDEYKYLIKKEYKDHKAFAQDASDYAATLYTTSDFGCVQFERR